MSENMHHGEGRLYGVGVGPGDPELLTRKACRLIESCDVIAYLSNASGHSMARTIASAELERRNADSFDELAITITMSRDRRLINAAYDDASRTISTNLSQGKDVAFLCEGDPLFFGSFAYLAQRLCDEHDIEIVPGISSIMAGPARTGRSLGLQTENLAIISGRHSVSDIQDTLNRFDNVAIMKAGSQRASIKRVIEQTGRTQDACYVEYLGHANERIVHNIQTLNDDQGPYFSLFLINHPRTETAVT